MSHQLWVFNGGAAPRRVVIYSVERNFPEGLIDIIPATISGPGAPAIAPGKPSGAVPLLALPSGELIGESLSIIEYLEDIAESRGMPPLRGNTAIERAKVRTLLGIIETVTLSVEIAAVNGSVAFASLVEDQQSAGLERWLLAFIHKNLKQIAEIADPKGPFLIRKKDTNSEMRTEVTTADCALFAILQYASSLWGLNLVEEHRRLGLFYDAFKARPSATVPENTWPSEMTAVTKQFIQY
ncbi:Fc.00g079850.m01.CDS01 [Cosmosporella sp. VM-42]